MITEKKSRLIPDGWHTVKGGISYCVEGGYIVRGVTADGQHAVYPYKPSRHGGYDLFTPRAYYSALCRIYWF